MWTYPYSIPLPRTITFKRHACGWAAGHDCWCWLNLVERHQNQLDALISGRRRRSRKSTRTPQEDQFRYGQLSKSPEDSPATIFNNIFLHVVLPSSIAFFLREWVHILSKNDAGTVVITETVVFVHCGERKILSESVKRWEWTDSRSFSFHELCGLSHILLCPSVNRPFSSMSGVKESFDILYRGEISHWQRTYPLNTVRPSFLIVI